MRDCAKRMPASRISGTPNFLPQPLAAPEIGSPTPRLCRSLSRSLTPPSRSRTRRSSFTSVKETKMTYSLEIQIEELRAELRNAIDGAERRQIQAELEIIQAELAIAAAELDGLAKIEPPF